MSDEEELIPEFIPVPAEFQSFATDSLFERCCICDRHLLEDGTQYLIEKAIERNEVVFELAFCLPCQLGVRSEFSEGSLRTLKHYFEERVCIETRKPNLIALHGLDHTPWISHCIFCNQPSDGPEWKQLVALCDGPDLLFTETAPLMICQQDILQIQKIMSKKTKDCMDGFIDDVLGKPSGTVDLPFLV